MVLVPVRRVSVVPALAPMLLVLSSVIRPFQLLLPARLYRAPTPSRPSPLRYRNSLVTVADESARVAPKDTRVPVAADPLLPSEPAFWTTSVPPMTLVK